MLALFGVEFDRLVDGGEVGWVDGFVEGGEAIRRLVCQRPLYQSLEHVFRVPYALAQA